jgi:dTDP-4-dehydrorhamnose 3,5-epimerase
METRPDLEYLCLRQQSALIFIHPDDKIAIMKFLPTAIPDVVIIEPAVFGDQRGFFMETYQEQLFKQAGIDSHFVQDNHSGSRKGTLRGLHFQIQQVQGKLVRVAAGEVFDVAVDLRRSSATFGKWVSAYLSVENRRQVWIPEGFAHGVLVLSEWAELLYKTTDFYAPAHERTLRWDDPDVGIIWPGLQANQSQPGEAYPTPILSPKDMQGLSLRELTARGEIFD